MNKTSVFKVAAGTDPNSLAGAIARAIRKKETVSLQAIGAGPVNQANKAVIIARGYLTPIGIELVIVPAFQTLELDGHRAAFERDGIGRGTNKMKGLWKVVANPVGGTMLYGIARLHNTEEVTHSGNLEFHPCGYLEDRDEAKAIAEQMNQEEVGRRETHDIRR